MSINLENLTTQELQDLRIRAEKREKQLHRERLSEVRQKITDMAKAEGYTIEELFGYGTKKKGGSRGKVPPKYRNPGNPSQTWSGRGKRPNWFRDALSQGKTERDLLI